MNNCTTCGCCSAYTMPNCVNPYYNTYPYYGCPSGGCGVNCHTAIIALDNLLTKTEAAETYATKEELENINTSGGTSIDTSSFATKTDLDSYVTTTEFLGFDSDLGTIVGSDYYGNGSWDITGTSISSRLTALENNSSSSSSDDLTALMARVSTLETANTNLTSRVATLESTVATIQTTLQSVVTAVDNLAGGSEEEETVSYPGLLNSSYIENTTDVDNTMYFMNFLDLTGYDITDASATQTIAGTVNSFPSGSTSPYLYLAPADSSSQSLLGKYAGRSVGDGITITYASGSLGTPTITTSTQSGSGYLVIALGSVSGTGSTQNLTFTLTNSDGEAPITFNITYTYPS